MSLAAYSTASATAASRTGREKVAILLLALGKTAGASLLQKFDADDVRNIMGSASAIGPVDKDDLELLVDDFAAHFGKAIGLGTDFDSVRSLIEQAFSPSQLNTMLGAEADQPREPVWRKFAAGSENTLVPYLLDEHPQTVAFVLSKLDADFAARCLSILPGDFRNTVARRLLQLRQVGERVVLAVEGCLQRDLLSRSETGQTDESRNRLAAILNKLDRDQSAAILASVAAWKPDEAGLLKKLVFSFEDIGRLSQPARLALFDKVQTEQVITALRGMPDALKEVALSSLGARARRMVEAELGNDSGQRAKDGDLARGAIASLVLDMASRGEIELPTADASAVSP